MPTQPDLERRVALVTGGAAGIGAEVCRRLAAAGHQVLVADLNLDAAQASAQALCADNGRAAALAIDVGRPESIAQASVAGMRTVGSGRTAYGITANAVAPGPVDTPMTQVLHTERFRQEYSKAIPMNRYGTTGEIASAVLYLVSEDASYISGIVLPVDGGFLASGARGL